MPVKLGGLERLKVLIGGTIRVNAAALGQKLKLYDKVSDGNRRRRFMSPRGIHQNRMNKRKRERIVSIADWASWERKFQNWRPELSGFIDYLEYAHNFDLDDGVVSKMVQGAFQASSGREQLHISMIVHNSNRDRLKRIELNSTTTGLLTIWTDEGQD